LSFGEKFGKFSQTFRPEIEQKTPQDETFLALFDLKEPQMKFSVASSELQKALTKISGVVPSKSTLPILENILFDLSKNTLRLAATDLEVSMSASIEVKGSADGKIAVPAKRIMETIRALPDVQLSFTADLSVNKIKMITETGEYAFVGESS
jgi:DNA polymerase-3 subunit beta